MSIVSRVLDGEPSEKRLKVLTIIGCIPVVGLLVFPLFLRDMAKIDERIASYR